MGPSLIQRQCPEMQYGFPVVILALPSFQTRYFYSRCPAAKFLKNVPERRKAALSAGTGTKPQKSMVRERI